MSACVGRCAERRRRAIGRPTRPGSPGGSVAESRAGSKRSRARLPVPTLIAPSCSALAYTVARLTPRSRATVAASTNPAPTPAPSGFARRSSTTRPATASISFRLSPISASMSAERRNCLAPQRGTSPDQPPSSTTMKTREGTGTETQSALRADNPGGVGTYAPTEPPASDTDTLRTLGGREHLFAPRVAVAGFEPATLGL
jgi:hypothetical protein